MNNNRQNRIRFLDDSAPQKTFTCTFDDGFKASLGGTEITFVKDRGELPTVPEPLLGEDQEIEISFNAKIKTLTSTTEAAAGDFLLGRNGAGYVNTAWTSTITSAGFSFMAVDIEFYDGVNTWLYEDCVVRGSYTEGAEGNTLEFTAVCPHPYPTVT